MKKVHRAMEKHYLYCSFCENFIHHLHLKNPICKHVSYANGHKEFCRNEFHQTPYDVLHHLGKLSAKITRHKLMTFFFLSMALMSFFLPQLFSGLIAAAYSFFHAWSGAEFTVKPWSVNRYIPGILFFLLIMKSTYNWVHIYFVHQKFIREYAQGNGKPLYLKSA